MLKAVIYPGYFGDVNLDNTYPEYFLGSNLSLIYEKLSRQAANIIAATVISKPKCVLGLATGSSPLGTYAKMIENNEFDVNDIEKTIDAVESKTEEIEKIIEEDGKAELSCHFCSNKYEFNEDDLRGLLEEMKND